MLKLKLPYFGHLMWWANSLEKTLILGKIEGRRRRGWQRMRWLDGVTGYKFEQILADSGQRSLARYSPWGCRIGQLSDWTKIIYKKLNSGLAYLSVLQFQSGSFISIFFFLTLYQRLCQPNCYKSFCSIFLGHFFRLSFNPFMGFWIYVSIFLISKNLFWFLKYSFTWLFILVSWKQSLLSSLKGMYYN